MEKKNNIKAILSLVFGCLSVLNACTWFFAILFGTVGFVLGILALKEPTQKQRDVAIAGIVVSSVGVVLGITIAIVYISLYSSSPSETLPPSQRKFDNDLPDDVLPDDSLPDSGADDIMFKLNFMKYYLLNLL